MDEPRFYRRPWVYYLFWLLLFGGVYFWQIRGLGGVFANLFTILGDALIFLLGLLVWLAFFSQFVLPVRTFRDRQKIFDRVLGSMFGGRGPAIFVRDGVLIKAPREQEKQGPGVLWLDSASAAVTRTATRFKATIGPGVHFTEAGEYPAGSVDLHTQVQRLGPQDKDIKYLFASKSAENGDLVERERHEEANKRKATVSAWTRDGIEVVPNVSVTFKIDARPAKGEQPGSRFGYEADSVRKAVTGEGVNPDPKTDSHRRVPWNQLPALLAVDLWREYLAKFTLQQLFETEQSLPLEPLAPSGPVPAETQALYEAAYVASGDGLAGMLHEFNAWLARQADRCESGRKEVIRVRPEIPKPAPAAQPAKAEEKVTALQVINHMISSRMKQAQVPILDDSGRPGSGTLPSPEYQLLQERGLRVISASVSGLNFDPGVEEQLIRQWSATWLDNAHAERERIERQRSFAELDERVEAVGAYAESLSRNLLKTNPGQKNSRGVLKTLLLRTRDELLKDDRLHRRAGMECEELEEIVQWVERNGP